MKTELQHSTNVHSERSTPPDAKHLLAPVPLSVVFNEDCMAGLKRFPDGYFDLAICDIPYGINVGKMAYLKETKTTVKQKNGTRLNGNKNKEVYTQKDWDKEPPTQEYFDELKALKEANKNFTKPDVIGSLCLHKGCLKQSTCGDYCGTHCNCNKKAK